MENVLFFDKKGRTRGFDSEQLRQVLPREVNSEALMVVCMKEDRAVLREARELFKAWAKATFRGRSGFNYRIVD